MVERLVHLVISFAVDVLDFAIMDNHFHFLLRNRPDIRNQWTDREVAERWSHVCPSEWQRLKPKKRSRKKKDDSPVEPEVDPREQYIQQLLRQPAKLAKLRRRLGSISWFIKLFAEYVARRANQEDEQKGHFWGQRFHSDRILDLAHLLACSMYINLNPIRAKMAYRPEDSLYTSLRLRLDALAAAGQAQNGVIQGAIDHDTQKSVEPAHGSIASARMEPFSAPYQHRWSPADGWLSPLSLQRDIEPNDHGSLDACMSNPFPASRASNKGFLEMTFVEYIKLIDWTGRQPVQGKAGAIPEELKPIAERLRIDLATWGMLVSSFDKKGRAAYGSPELLRAEAVRRKQRWLRGMKMTQANSSV